jgi:hypothetical protein
MIYKHYNNKGKAFDIKNFVDDGFESWRNPGGG